MNKLTQTLVLATLVAAIGHIPAQALTITDIGSTAPTSNVVISSPTADFAGDTFTRSFRVIGQTFTPSTSFSITGISLLVNSSAGNLITANWTLVLGLAAGGGQQTETDSPGVDYVTSSNGHYLQFTLITPYAVTGGTQYGFGVNAATSSLSNYLQFQESTGDSFAGGNAYYSDGTIPGTHATEHDLTFSVSSSPVPEPSNWALVPVLGTLAFLGFRRMKSSAAI